MNQNPSSDAQHVVIVGGGITGLATAYYLQKQAEAQNIPLRYTLIEKAPGLGGKVVSHVEDGFIVEGGPDSFLTQKPWAWQLCQELGLADRLVGTNDHRRNIYVLHKGKLVPFPDGMRLTVPTRLTPFITTPLLSLWGKLRAGLDLLIPKRAAQSDESVADFISRRLGKEMLERIAAPIMAGIHVADPHTLSIQSTFPRYPDMEEKYGGLIKGTLAQMKAAKQAQASGSGAKKPMFMSLKGGLTEMISTLVAQLTGDLVTGQSVTALAPNPDYEDCWQITLSNGQSYQADSVILTTPTYVSAPLLETQAPDLAQELNQIRYLSSATISLAFKKSEISHPLDGFGFVVPKSEPCRLLACTWVSTKFDGRAPDDQVLIRAFVGGYSQEDLVDLSDEALVQLVREELSRIMGIDAQPTLQLIYRWHKANPQYDVGHLDRVAKIFQLAEEQVPGLYLTGCAFHGVGMPDCVRQGKEAAAKAISHLTHKVNDHSENSALVSAKALSTETPHS